MLPVPVAYICSQSFEKEDCNKIVRFLTWTPKDATNKRSQAIRIHSNHQFTAIGRAA